MGKQFSRRSFMKFLGASSLFAVSLGMAQTPDPNAPRVVIVGGGFAGATCAKYLKMWGGNGVNVTIVEASK